MTDYHARIDSFDGESLTLTLLADVGKGSLEPAADGPESFEAIVGSERNAGLSSRKATFDKADGDGRYVASFAEFSFQPDDLILLVVPSIELGGERLDFSFPLPAANGSEAKATEADDSEADDSEAADAGDEQEAAE